MRTLVSVRSPTAPTRWRQGWLVFFGVALVYLAFLRTGIIVIDGRSMFAVAWSLAHKGSFAIPCSVGGSPVGIPGRGGVCYSQWYPLLSVLAAPVVAFAARVASPLGLPQVYLASAASLLVPALCAAGAAGMTSALARGFGASRRGAVLAAIAMAFGTEMFTYARTFFAEAPAALLVAVGAWGLFGDRRARWISYGALAVAVLAKPQMVVVGPALGLGFAIATRQPRALIAPSLAAAAGGIVYLGYNLLRFGNVTNFGPPAHFSPAHLPAGIAVLLVSPGRGLLWYSPLAVLGAFVLWQKRSDPRAAAHLTASAAILVEYASKVPLGGGFGWGTRLLVPALPLLCAPIGILTGRLAKVAASLAIIGLIVEMPTSISFFERYYSEMFDKGVPSTQLVWSVSRSPLIGVWTTAAHTVQDAAKADPHTLITQSGVHSRTVSDAPLLHGLAVWWWYLPALGIPLWVGVLIALGMIVAAAFILRRAATAPYRPRGDPDGEAGPESDGTITS
jgi:hypothetical protein